MNGARDNAKDWNIREGMPKHGNETILVVDDETIILTLAQAMLTRFGYTVLAARSGDEALRFFEIWPDQQVDLALLDIVMRMMDGFELAEHLRRLRPTLPILYMSAYPERVELRPERTRNIPFLGKPFTSVTLTGKIRELLDTPNQKSVTA
jgi:CheY-like chemotaxis protein